MASGETPADERQDMIDTSTPAEFVKLRDQLALDLVPIVGDGTGQARRSAEYLLASGLVPLSTIRARYDKTHPAPEGDDADAESWERGDGIEVGVLVEYVGGGDQVDNPERIGKCGRVTFVNGRTAEVDGLPGNSLLNNLRRIR